MYSYEAIPDIRSKVIQLAILDNMTAEQLHNILAYTEKSHPSLLCE